nr:MAG TPA: hypothetical protein [Bacteriophage sp.]
MSLIQFLRAKLTRYVNIITQCYIIFKRFMQ